MNLIGIHGRAGVGKSTFAEILRKHIGGDVLISGFADCVKLELAELFGIDVARIEQLKRTDPRMRWLLQHYGTEWGREVLGEWYWVQQFVKRLEDKDPAWVIIPDVRFWNEAHWIVDVMGGKMVELTRPNNPDFILVDHVSEHRVAFEPMYQVVNDGDLTQLEYDAGRFIKNTYES